MFFSILLYHIMFINKSSHPAEVQLVSQQYYFYSYIYFVCSLHFSVLGDSSATALTAAYEETRIPMWTQPGTLRFPTNGEPCILIGPGMCPAHIYT